MVLSLIDRQGVMAAIAPWVGSDVCQRWWDVHLRPQGASGRVRHQERGLQALLKQLQVPERVGRILLESTGG